MSCSGGMAMVCIIAPPVCAHVWRRSRHTCPSTCLVSLKDAPNGRQTCSCGHAPSRQERMYASVNEVLSRAWAKLGLGAGLSMMARERLDPCGLSPAPEDCLEGGERRSSCSKHEHLIRRDSTASSSPYQHEPPAHRQWCRCFLMPVKMP